MELSVEGLSDCNEVRDRKDAIAKSPQRPLPGNMGRC
jgi:hypothetical protein